MSINKKLSPKHYERQNEMINVKGHKSLPKH